MVLALGRVPTLLDCKPHPNESARFRPPEWLHHTVTCVSESNWYESSFTSWNTRLLDLQSVSSIQRRWTQLAASNIFKLVNRVTGQGLTQKNPFVHHLRHTCLMARQAFLSKAHCADLPTKHSHQIFLCRFSSNAGHRGRHKGWVLMDGGKAETTVSSPFNLFT